MNLKLMIMGLLVSCVVFADTPPPGTVKAKMYSGDGTQAIGTVSDALKASITNSSIAVTGSLGRTWSLSNLSDSCTVYEGGSWSVDVGNFPATQNVNVTNASIPVTGTFWQATQPVSATSLPLPTGAATESTLSTLNGKVTTTLNGIKVDGSGVTQPVSGSVSVSNFPATQPISAASLPLPSNAAQETGGNLATIATNTTGVATAANQTTGNSSLSSIDGKITTTANGVKVDGSGVTQPVSGSVSVSNFPATQPVSGSVSVSNFPATQSVTQVGRTSISLARNTYSTSNVTTSAYVQLIASTPDTVNSLDIFDSSGQTLALAVGPALSEVDQLYIVPGGNGLINLSIPPGSRVSVKAISATANTGELDITFYK